MKSSNQRWVAAPDNDESNRPRPDEPIRVREVQIWWKIAGEVLAGEDRQP